MSRTHRRFSFIHKDTLGLSSAIQSLLEIFPEYEVYLGCKRSDELYQSVMEAAYLGGNKMFWLPVSNEQVELELRFLVTRDRFVEVQLSQRELSPVIYAHHPSTAA